MDRWRCLVTVVVCVIGTSACSGPAPAQEAAPTAAAVGTSVGPAAAPGSHWAGVLTRLDRKRARAYAASDLGSLSSVYAPGSTALRNDRQMLRAYAKRGITLRGVRLDLLAVHRLDRGIRQVRLRVVDRLQRPIAHLPGGAEMLLPQDQATRWLIELRRRNDRWQIATVRRLAG